MANILEIIFICGLGLIFMTSTCSAYTGIFEILDEPYIQNVSELPPSTSLKPDIQWTPSDWSDQCKRDRSPYFIFSWIDIVGYRNAVKIDGNFYINEPAKDAAIIEYKSYSCVFLPVFKLPIHNTVEVYQEGNNLFAKLTATQRMFSIYAGYYSWYNLTQTFYDHEPAPLQIDQSNEDIQVIIRERNYSILNITETEIRINTKIYDRYIVETDTGYYEKINRLWHVENTSKGVFFANESKVNIFNSDNISHAQDVIDTHGKNFTVSANGFYHSTNKTIITKEYEYSDPVAQFFNLDLIGFLLILSSFYIFIIHIKRQFI